MIFARNPSWMKSYSAYLRRIEFAHLSRKLICPTKPFLISTSWDDDDDYDFSDADNDDEDELIGHFV